MGLSKRILLVDDDRTARHRARYLLKNLGFENIIEANDGDSGLFALKKEKVDLIISDWYMPGMSGLDFFKALQKKEDFKGIPFLMTTSEREKGKVVEALKLGVKHYIVKPVEAETLEPKIKLLLG